VSEKGAKKGRRVNEEEEEEGAKLSFFSPPPELPLLTRFLYIARVLCHQVFCPIRCFLLLRLNNLLPLFQPVIFSQRHFPFSPLLILLHFACRHPRVPALRVPFHNNVRESFGGQSPSRHSGEKTEKVCVYNVFFLLLTVISLPHSFRKK
jgi:hypothetical protein